MRAILSDNDVRSALDRHGLVDAVIRRQEECRRAGRNLAWAGRDVDPPLASVERAASFARREWRPRGPHRASEPVLAGQPPRVSAADR